MSFAGVVVVSVLVCLFSGCGPRVAGPPQDNIYRLPLSVNPPTLDPAHFTDLAAEGVASRIFSSLVKYDSDLNIAPDLAETWEVSEDGKTYTFRLRQGVKFHSGRVVTADDVKYSFERLLNPETGSKRPWVVKQISGAGDMLAGEAKQVSGLVVVDTHTVKLTVDEPFAPLLSQLAMTNASIVPKEVVEAQGRRFGRHPIGTGPFKFDSWVDNSHLLLTRFDDYFEGPAKLAGIKFRIVKEELLRYEEYRAGNFEHCGVPIGQLAGISESNLGAELRTVPNLSTAYIGLNLTKKPLGENLKLRQALNWAVNRQFLCEKLLQGSRLSAKGVLPPGIPGYNSELSGYGYDPNRAQELLKEAGFPDGRGLRELSLYYTARQQSANVAQRFQSDVKKIGVSVRLKSLDWGAFLEAVDKREPDMFLLSWIADYPDPDNFLYILFHSSQHGSLGNRVIYSNPAVDRLLEAERSERDVAARLQLCQQAEQAIVEAAPWVFLSHGRNNLLVKPYVENLRLSSMDVGTEILGVDFHRVRCSLATGK